MALVDGATRLRILRRITLPLAVPGLISAGIFSFTLSWNEFIYALAFIQSGANKTVPVAILTELVTGDVYQWGALMAGSLLGSLPGRDVLLAVRGLLRVVADRRAVKESRPCQGSIIVIAAERSNPVAFGRSPPV